MNKTVLKLVLTGIIAGYAAVGVLTYKNIKNALGSFDNEVRSDIGGVHNLLDSLKTDVDSLKINVNSLYTEFENTKDYFRESMEADLESSFNDLTKKLEDRNDKKEFPHIENFTVLAKNLGIPKRELRNLQRYFKAYNNHIAQNIDKYSTNL